jgi:hypothetical protein
MPRRSGRSTASTTTAPYYRYPAAPLPKCNVWSMLLVFQLRGFVPRVCLAMVLQSLALFIIICVYIDWTIGCCVSSERNHGVMYVCSYFPVCCMVQRYQLGDRRCAVGMHWPKKWRHMLVLLHAAAAKWCRPDSDFSAVLNRWFSTPGRHHAELWVLDSRLRFLLFSNGL